MNTNHLFKATQAALSPSDNLILITKAVHFAAQKHTDQRRKGNRAEPYANHLAEVAEILAIHTDGLDPTLIAAGYLHDTIEDTDTTYEDLIAEFGSDVADVVREVTDDKTLPKAERKRLQVENAPHKSQRAQMIKIADKISNLNAILNSPPADWDHERKRAYFDWAKEVVSGCHKACPSLIAAFDDTYIRL